MKYIGVRCVVMSPGRELDSSGRQAYFGRCACGWESSIYSTYPVDAEVDTELHIVRKNRSS